MDKFKNRMRINNNSLDVKNKPEFLEKQVSGIFDKQELVNFGEKNEFEGENVIGNTKQRKLVNAKKSTLTEDNAGPKNEKTYIKFHFARGVQPILDDDNEYILDDNGDCMFEKEEEGEEEKKERKQKNEQLYSREIFNSILLNYLGQPTPNAYYGKSEKGESKVYMEKQKIEVNEETDLVKYSVKVNESFTGEKQMLKEGVDVYLQGKDLCYLPNTENNDFSEMLLNNDDFLRKHIRSNIINFNLGTSYDRNIANFMYNPETRVYLSIDNDDEIKTDALNVSIFNMYFAGHIGYNSEFINVLDDNAKIREKTLLDSSLNRKQYFQDNVLDIFKEEYKEFSRKLLLLDNNTLDAITKPTCQSFLSDGIKKQFIENVNKVQGGLILKFQSNGNLHKLFGLPQEHEEKISNIIFGSVSNELKQYTDLLEKYKNLVEEDNNLREENQKMMSEQYDMVLEQYNKGIIMSKQNKEIIKKCEENAARRDEIRNKQNELKINMDNTGTNIWNHCNKSLFDLVNKNYGASFNENDTIESVFNKSKDLLIGKITGVEVKEEEQKEKQVVFNEQQHSYSEETTRTTSTSAIASNVESVDNKTLTREEKTNPQDLQSIEGKVNPLNNQTQATIATASPINKETLINQSPLHKKKPKDISHNVYSRPIKKGFVVAQSLKQRENKNKFVKKQHKSSNDKGLLLGKSH